MIHVRRESIHRISFHDELGVIQYSAYAKLTGYVIVGEDLLNGFVRHPAERLLCARGEAKGTVFTFDDAPLHFKLASNDWHISTGNAVLSWSRFHSTDQRRRGGVGLRQQHTVTTNRVEPGNMRSHSPHMSSAGAVPTQRTLQGSHQIFHSPFHPPPAKGGHLPKAVHHARHTTPSPRPHIIRSPPGGSGCHFLPACSHAQVVDVGVLQLLLEIRRLTNGQVQGRWCDRSDTSRSLDHLCAQLRLEDNNLLQPCCSKPC